jgi:glyoxylase I family protein
MEHFALFADDPKELKDFYVEVMGLRVALDNGAGTPPGYFLVDESGLALEIIGRPSGTERAETRYLYHLAFSVNDVAAERKRLEALGRVFETDTVVDTPTMKTAFFRDPDGNRLQIVWRSRALGR